MRELDLSMELGLTMGSWFDLESLICCISCSSVIDCYIFTLCMHRSEYLSLSDSLQRIRRCSSKMNELDLGKEWLMVYSYLLSISCISCPVAIGCVTCTDVYA
jgi:hypothetical protein